MFFSLTSHCKTTYNISKTYTHTKHFHHIYQLHSRKPLLPSAHDDPPRTNFRLNPQLATPLTHCTPDA